MARTGRPTKLNEQLDNGKTVGEQIVDAIRAGNYFEQACAAAGVHRNSGFRWLKQGAQISKRIDQAGSVEAAKLSSNQRDYYDFWCAVGEAEAKWEVAAVTSLEIAARGSSRDPRSGEMRGPSRVVETVQVDGDGLVVSRTVRTEWLPPDNAVLMWRLERKFPDRYGRQPEVVAVVPDPLDASDRANSVADKLEAYLEGVADGASSGSTSGS